MSHTPGPWHDDGYRIYAPTTDADPRNGRVIVEYKHRDDFSYDDAPLIASAPELLAACRRALDEIVVLASVEDACGCSGAPPLCVVCDLRNAIAMAVGNNSEA